MTLDEQIDEILASYKRFVMRDDYDETATAYPEVVTSYAIKNLIAERERLAGREAVKEEKSIRAKLVTKAHKDGIADGLQMALYGVKDGSKEEKFIRHLLYSENIGDDK